MKFFNTQINPNEITLLHLQKNLVTCDLLGKDRNSFIEKYNREEDALARFEEIVAEIEDLGLVKINFGYYTIAKNISTMNFANKKLSITFKDETQIQVESEQSYVDNIVATQLQAGGGSGGVTNYEKLTNLPSVNGVTLKGDKNSSSLGLQDKLTSEQLNAIDQVKDKQDKLTAGKGIEISADGVITATGDISNLQHSELLGRDVANQHPISAIEGLQDALGSKQNSLTEKQLEDINKIDEKQDSLTATQLKAVNSGITSEKVSEYDSYATTKQDALSQEQLESVNSTITKSKVDSFEALKTSKQDALTTEQLNATNSGITETNFNELNTEVETIKNDQETLGNDLGTLSNTVGLKDDLPDTSKSITQNISSISTKVSGLIKDDESSATTTYSSSKILGLIGDIHTFDVLVVDALPDVGVEKTIYFVPATTTKDKNIYDEYLYINNAWELIGSTQVDLSNYLKIDGSNGTETGINALLNLISAGEDDILDTSNILFENTAFKKKTALSFVNYLKNKIIDDTTASTSTVYSSSKIEEINTQVWSGTTSEFEALDKTTLKDGQVVNITDDYDEPNTKDVYSLSEVKTNKVWIDGKSVYRTVTHTNIPADSNKYVIQEFDGTNIDRIIALYGGVKQLEGSNQTTISFYRDTTDGLFLYFDNATKRLCAKTNAIGGGDAYIVIEYTKTTD